MRADHRPVGSDRSGAALMVRLDDVAAMTASLPHVEEGVSQRGGRSWNVDGKTFLWERPFSKADIKRFGSDPVPSGTIVAVRVDDLGEKEALLGMGHKGFFDIPHFNGYPALLIQLSVASKRAVRDAVEDAWLACAPKKLVTEYLAAQRR
jgi:hypothetical protein